MGTWSGEPFGNDTAADFAWELDEHRRWAVVRGALREALRAESPIDANTASIAIAAAEVVAHGIGRPTQSDPYTSSVERFAVRASRPSRRVVREAAQALEAASAPDGELAELWADGGACAWRTANDRLREALAVG